MSIQNLVILLVYVFGAIQINQLIMLLVHTVFNILIFNDYVHTVNGVQRIGLPFYKICTIVEDNKYNFISNMNNENNNIIIRAPRHG